jgi:hypothetical protein
MLSAGFNTVWASSSRDAHEAAAHETLVPVLATLMHFPG